MPTYKLTYFNLKGRAELSRYIFAYGDIKYEDQRVDQAEWAKIKPTLPFKQVPVLEVDGKILSQSFAIARFLAREAGVAGKTSLEQAQADMLVDTIFEPVVLVPWREQDEAVKKEKIEKLFKDTVPGWLANLEAYLGDNTWFVGDSVTWADFQWHIASVVLDTLKPGFLKGYSKLEALRDRVGALPKIAAYLKARPVTPM
ncbi:hematopoietic prostaglandin D synthase [Lethenteron reissneri]|uniref:hematopoietic prostaglandin D synthase n=1 Tax=Lethenteron reissneri TaxID=7753 RepID=UPI002AB644E2|nr:hematopoietic prostaglandin D synthase [Lethenteron reissneri]